jgi:hypothetical protein
MPLLRTAPGKRICLASPPISTPLSLVIVQGSSIQLVGATMAQGSFWEQLEAANDEQDVRRRLAADLYHSMHSGTAKEWLRFREATRSGDAAARAEAREVETLAIARSADSVATEALRIARSQKKIAVIAAIASIVAALAAIAPYVFQFLKRP